MTTWFEDNSQSIDRTPPGGLNHLGDGAPATILASDPDRYVLLKQFKNPANPAIRETATGPEIWEDTEGAIDILVSRVGPGRTTTGISHDTKRTRGKPILAVPVEPANSPVPSLQRASQPLKTAPHKIQGIGAGSVPDALELSLLDEVALASHEEPSTTRVGWHARKLSSRGSPVARSLRGLLSDPTPRAKRSSWCYRTRANAT